MNHKLKKGFIYSSWLSVIAALGFYTSQQQWSNDQLTQSANIQLMRSDNNESKNRTPWYELPVMDSLLSKHGLTTKITEAFIQPNMMATQLYPMVEYGRNENIYIDLSVATNDNSTVKDILKVEWYFVVNGQDVKINPSDYEEDETKGIKINSDKFVDTNKIKAVCSMTNDLNYTSTITTNTLTFNINTQEQYPETIPQVETVVNHHFPLDQTFFPFEEPMYYVADPVWKGTSSASHNYKIEYKWWGTNSRSKVLLPNSSGFYGVMWSEMTLYSINRIALEMIVDGKSYYSSGATHMPDDGEGSIPPSGPVLDDIIIVSNKSNAEYEEGELMTFTANMQWNQPDVNLDNLNVQYYWYIQYLGGTREPLNSSTNTITIPAKKELDGQGIMCVIRYRDIYATSSNIIKIKTYEQQAIYPVIKSVVINTDKKKYAIGDTISFSAELTWNNSTEPKIYEYHWFQEIGGVAEELTTDEILRVTANLKSNSTYYYLSVTYRSDGQTKTITSGKKIAFVQIPFQFKPMDKAYLILFISLGIAIVLICILANIIYRQSAKFQKDLMIEE